MPPFYLIYCEELRERFDATMQHLQERGLQPIPWRGLHGVTFGIQATHRPNPESVYVISQGHLALMINHLFLWQHLYLSGVKEAIICEDDVTVGIHFKERLAVIQCLLPKDMEICFLGVLGGDRSREEVYYYRDHHMPDMVVAEGGCESLVKFNHLFGTHCYLVRRPALPKLINAVQRADTQIDVAIRDRALPLLNYCMANPSLAYQRSVPGGTGIWEGTLAQ